MLRHFRDAYGREQLLADAAAAHTTAASKHGIKPLSQEAFRRLFGALCAWASAEIAQGRGISIPRFCCVVHRFFHPGIHIPFFLLNEKFCNEHRLQQRQVASVVAPRQQNMAPLRVAALATASRLDTQAAASGLETLFRTLGKALAVQRRANVDFSFGRLLAERQHVKFSVTQNVLADSIKGKEEGGAVRPAEAPTPPSKARPPLRGSKPAQRGGPARRARPTPHVRAVGRLGEPAPTVDTAGHAGRFTPRVEPSAAQVEAVRLQESARAAAAADDDSNREKGPLGAASPRTGAGRPRGGARWVLPGGDSARASARSARAGAGDIPPPLDAYSRTRAATYRDAGDAEWIVDVVGSHYTPSLRRVTLSAARGELRWRSGVDGGAMADGGLESGAAEDTGLAADAGPVVAPRPPQSPWRRAYDEASIRARAEGGEAQNAHGPGAGQRMPVSPPRRRGGAAGSASTVFEVPRHPPSLMAQVESSQSGGRGSGSALEPAAQSSSSRARDQALPPPGATTGVARVAEAASRQVDAAGSAREAVAARRAGEEMESLRRSMRLHQRYLAAIPDSQLAPLPRGWVAGVLERLPSPGEALDEEAVDHVVSESLRGMEAGYAHSLRRAILAYVLQSPAEQRRLHLRPVPEPFAQLGWGWDQARRLAPVPAWWRARVAEARAELEQSLRCTLPPMPKLQALWCDVGPEAFLALPQSDAEALAQGWRPQPVDAFESRTVALVATGSERLLKEWIPRAADAAAWALRNGHVPADTDERAAFFRAVATLMARQARQVVEATLERFVAFLDRFGGEDGRRDSETLARLAVRRRLGDPADAEAAARVQREEAEETAEWNRAAEAADKRQAEREAPAPRAAVRRHNQRKSKEAESSSDDSDTESGSEEEESEDGEEDVVVVVSAGSLAEGVGATEDTGAARAGGGGDAEHEEGALEPQPSQQTKKAGKSHRRHRRKCRSNKKKEKEKEEGKEEGAGLAWEAPRMAEIVHPFEREAALAWVPEAGWTSDAAVPEHDPEADRRAFTGAGPVYCSATTRLARPAFTLEACVSGSSLAFKTPAPEFERRLLHVFDRAAVCLGEAVRVEHKGIGVDMPTPRLLPTVSPQEPSVQRQRQRVRLRAQEGYAAAEQVLPLYAPFLYLLEEEAAASRWLQRDRGEEELAERIARYRAAAARVRTFAADEVEMGMVLVQLGPLNDALAQRAEALVDLVLTRTAERLTEDCQALCQGFKALSDRATRKPGTTQELQEAEWFIAQEREGHLLGLLDSARQLRERLRFLYQHRHPVRQHVLQPVDAAFGWVRRIDSVLRAGAQGVGEERSRLEGKTRRMQDAFEASLEEWEATLDGLRDRGEMRLLQETQSTIAALQQSLADGKEQADEINSEEERLGWACTDYTRVDELRTALQPYQDLWALAQSFSRNHTAWTEGPVLRLDPDAVEREAGAMLRRANRLAAELENDAPPAAGLARTIKADLEAFKPSIPLIRAVCTRGLRERHWRRMATVVGFPVKPDKQTSLQRLLEMGMQEHVGELQGVAEEAAREYAIEGGLDRMLTEWGDTEFALALRGDDGPLVLQGGPLEDMQQMLDDHMLRTQATRASAYARGFVQRIQQWERFLTHTQSALTLLGRVQAAWLYLDPIFACEDVADQIPEAAERFAKVDAWWRELMAQVAAAPKVVTVMKLPQLTQGLEEASASLDAIHRDLGAYLDAKRAAFPRFFFLANDELLAVLADARDAERVQPHLRKCFPAVHALQLRPNADVEAVCSAEGEQLALSDVVNPTSRLGAAEEWLRLLDRAMRSAVRANIARAVEDYSQRDVAQWAAAWPTQAALAAAQAHWTHAVEHALRSLSQDHDAGAVASLLTDQQRQLDAVVRLARGRLPPLTRHTVAALTVVMVHGRDVVRDLAETGVSRTTDFGWTSQLRFYWQGHGLVARMVHAEVEYGDEYSGAAGRLVVTPLTTRCFRTLASAVHLALGGAPQGPAGTGKTETVKDLARNAGRLCVALNCSDGMDAKGTATFFKGLAASGAWACLDEFNRIQTEVLSVAAQHIAAVQQAVARRQERVVLNGAEVAVQGGAALFVTMNPGFAGRSELPENFKALFRPCAMTAPDHGLIAQVSLLAAGYAASTEMAAKVVATFRLCAEQLSPQPHYDHSLRAVVAVLRAAAALKRKHAEEDEEALVLRAVRSVAVPKLLSRDLPLFEGVVDDLFPDGAAPSAGNEPLREAVREVAARRHLQPTEAFLEKTAQLYDTMGSRHGVMLIGAANAGKTECWRVLQDALSLLCDRGQLPCALHAEHELATEAFLINPKSVSLPALYGSFDAVSREWTDGVLATTFRSCASSDRRTRKWIVFDGPVDPGWTENLNSVLDDTRKLCLASGETMALSDAMALVFEGEDLSAASPAFVSRCGMVFMEPQQLGWRPLVRSWIEALPSALEHHATLLRGLFDWILPPCLEFAARYRQDLLCPATDATLATTTTRVLGAMLHLLTCDQGDGAGGDGKNEGKVGDDDEDGGEGDSLLAGAAPREACLWVSSAFLFAVAWAVGGCMTEDARRTFDAELRRTLQRDPGPDTMSAVGPVLAQRGSGSLLPGGADAGDTVFHFVFDVPGSAPGQEEGEGEAEGKEDRRRPEWRRWTALLQAHPTATPNGAGRADEVLVPTVRSECCAFLTQRAVEGGYAALFVGPTGTGKSASVAAALRRLDTATHQTASLVLSAQTTAAAVQQQVEACTDRRRRGVYGPPVGQRLAVFVDDLNLPAKEASGAQPPLELLRQLLDHGGWYGASDRAFRVVADLRVVAAMAPCGGRRSAVSERLLRHFAVVAVNELEDSTLRHVFGTVASRHFGGSGMPGGAAEAARALVDSSIRVYRWAARELRPTPSHSHYLFNPRDLAHVVEGLCLAPPAALRDGSSGGSGGGDVSLRLGRIWVHELLRVFGDRLVDADDRRRLLTEVGTQTDTALGVSLGSLLRHQGTADPDAAAEDLMCGDYAAVSGAAPHYDVISPDQARRAMQQLMQEHDATGGVPLDLVLFPLAVRHASRIARVLRMPGGHALLGGQAGSGRRSLTRLAAHLCGCAVHQVASARNYGQAEWREDVKRVVKAAGVEGRPTVFLMADTEIREERWLEDISALLNGGEVPHLFAKEEKAPLLEAVQQAARDNGEKVEGAEALWAAFTGRVRRYLHVVLAFSPASPAFRERLREFPSLVNCCTIDWFAPWPRDALRAVAAKCLRGASLRDGERAACTELCVRFHEDVRRRAARFQAELRRTVHVTPTSYLELLRTFRSMLGQQQAALGRARGRYEEGLQRLERTADAVADMQAELEELQPVLLRSTEETESMMRAVDAETEEAEKIRGVVASEEAIANEKAEQARVIKEECEADLAEALPVLDNAIASLNTLNKNDISEVKAMIKPPAGVKLVMKAVCIMMGVPPARVKDPENVSRTVLDYWEPAKRTLLSDPKLLSTLASYDKNSVDEATVAKIKPLLSDPEFDPANVKRTSTAAHGLCCWVRAMVDYQRVAKIVAPKREKLEGAEAEYERVMRGLRKKQGELQRVEDKLAELRRKLKATVARRDELQQQVSDCEQKLSRAAKLIQGLGGERTRWAKEATRLGDRLACVTGDVLLAAGTVAYLGPFDSTYRRDATAAWVKDVRARDVAASEFASLRDVFGDPVRIREWTIAGLPSDAFSIENAVIAGKARRWPLMIDPQGQANAWVRNKETERGLKILKPSHKHLLRVLEAALKSGAPVLLEDVGESVDAALEPLLRKQVFYRDEAAFISLGARTVPYSADFALYMTTKLPNPRYSPEVCVSVTLLNFTSTHEGLCDQLRGLVVSEERADLQEQREHMVVQSARHKKQLEEIEDKILSVLTSRSGSLLEDESAVEVLTSCKQVADEVNEKEEAAASTGGEIDRACAAYEPVAKYAATMFFAVADMAAVDPMYQYSLPWFKELFVAAIARAAPSRELPSRLAALRRALTRSLVRQVCRGLFARHRLVFAFHLATSLGSEAAGELPPVGRRELRFLLTGGVSAREAPPNPCASWLPEGAWGALHRLSEALPGSFGALPDDLRAHRAQWKRLFDSAAPEDARVWPEDWVERTTQFQRVCLVRCMRPDRTTAGMWRFAEAVLGEEEGEEVPEVDMGEALADASTSRPLVVVLAPGTDPSAPLADLAERQGAQLASFSLGEGQGALAEAAIRRAAQRGGWVVLQNCHLYPAWLARLEAVREEVAQGSVHAEYRLWLTSRPSEQFPVALLQDAIKVASEAPAGLRANLLGSLSRHPLCDAQFFDGCPRDGEFRQLAYGLCFFHAVVNARREFGALGWNVPYDFTESDLRVSLQQLHVLLSGAEGEVVPFEALRYLTGQCTYGGRVTDAMDRRCLDAVLAQCLSPSLLEGRHCFGGGSAYAAPGDVPYEKALEAVKSLPRETGPDVLGLHANADVIREQNDAHAAFQALLLAQPCPGGEGEGEGAGDENEEESGPRGPERLVRGVAEDLLSRLPEPFDEEAVREKYPPCREESLNAVLVQEVARFNALLAAASASLHGLCRAVDGIEVMSREVEGVFQSLFDGRVPQSWRAVSYHSLKPVSGFVSDLVARLAFFQRWVDYGPPAVFWLGAFFFPQAFLTATLQNHARRHDVAVDSLGFATAAFPRDDARLNMPPAEGAYVDGFFLQGARWDKHRSQLAEARRSVLFEPAPALWLRPDAKGGARGNGYACPVYQTSERRDATHAAAGRSANFVMTVDLPSDKAEAHWVRRGVALLLQPDDGGMGPGATSRVTMGQSVRVEKSPNGEVHTIVLSRPNVRNAVDRPTAEALSAAFREFDRDEVAKCAVLCGDHGTFCSGADLHAVAGGGARMNRLEADGDGPMGPTRMDLSKPVIAAVAGHAVAGGLELALWCDLRVVEENATLGVFCRRWGVPLIDGCTVRLPRLIGQARAMDLILTGRSVNAAEAERIGLASRVVPAGSARQAAEELAAQLCRLPQRCMRNDRASALSQWDMTHDEAMRHEFELGLDSLKESRQGAARFSGGQGRGGAAAQEEEEEGGPVEGLQAVIFDIGGVLVDSPFAVIERVEQEQGLPRHAIDRVIAATGSEGSFAKLERGEYSVPQFVGPFEEECAQAGITLNAKDLMQRILDDVQPRPLLREAVEELRAHSVKTAIVTNNYFLREEDRATPIDPLISRHFEGLFDEVVESCRTGLRKPDPAIFRLVLQRLQVPPEQAIFLDDIGRNLKGARSVGLHTLKVQRADRDGAHAVAALSHKVGFPLLRSLRKARL